MSDNDLRKLLSKLNSDKESEDARSVTKLLRLATALNEWDYPCVSRIECGFLVQDAGYVGDIELLLSNARGIWKVTVRPSEAGNLITFIDPDDAVDGKREKALRSCSRTADIFTCRHVCCGSAIRALSTLRGLTDFSRGADVACESAG